MSSYFITALNMSLTATYVAVGVIIFRQLIKKAPKIFSYALWAVVLFRLICPISFESSFSLVFGKTDAIPQNIMQSQNLAVNSGIRIIDNMVNQSIIPVRPEVSANPIGIFLEIAAVIWLLGIAILLCHSALSYFKLKNRLSTATLLRGNIFETDQIRTPFILGFIKPRIYIPTGLGDSELDYVLKHEETHIKRLDHIIKPLAFFALVLHWFNPIIWVSYSLMTKDMEMSCDESVMKQSREDIRASYSRSLFSLSVKQGGPLSPLAFGESNVKSRVKNVLSYKKPSFWMMTAAIIIVLGAAIGLSANPIGGAMNPIVDDNGKGVSEEIKSLAREFVKLDIANLEQNPEVKILESKITRLELLETIKDLSDKPVEVYALEYRLKPNDLSKVMLAGGMDIDENGWLKETSSMGSPLLVVYQRDGNPELLGIIWSAEMYSEGGLEGLVKELLNNRP
jgi:beta-lactamase regulating signal transducer with metallopeptidase domain